MLSCRVRWHMRGGMRVPYHARAPQQREQRSRFGHWRWLSGFLVSWPWCVEWVVVKPLSMLDYQRDRFARYATLHVAVRRLHAVEQTPEMGCPSSWASEHTFGELIDAGCPIPGCDGFWEWPRMRCGTCGECLHTCYCERECECGEVAKWSFSENGGVCVCPRPLPVSRELEKIFGT